MPMATCKNVPCLAIVLSSSMKRLIESNTYTQWCRHHSNQLVEDNSHGVQTAIIISIGTFLYVKSRLEFATVVLFRSELNSLDTSGLHSSAPFHKGSHSSAFIIPWCVCTAKDTVVVWSVCLSFVLSVSLFRRSVIAHSAGFRTWLAFTEHKDHAKLNRFSS